MDDTIEYMREKIRAAGPDADTRIMKKQLSLLEDTEPPMDFGKIRVYTDHTGRFYEDVTPEEYELRYNSEELKLLREEVQKEIDREMLEQMLKIYENYPEFSSSIQEEIDSELMDDLICEGTNQQEMSPERKKYLLDKWRAVLDNPAPYKTTMILEGQETFIPKIEDS